MSYTTDTSDHWGQHFIDCLVRKAKESFNPGKVIDEKHVLIDHIESNAVEDASENLDSIKKDQRSQTNAVVFPIRTEQQINQKNDDIITDELSERKFAQIYKSHDD